MKLGGCRCHMAHSRCFRLDLCTTIFLRLGHLHFSLQRRLRSEGHPILSMLRLVWKYALRLLYIGVNDEWLGGWGRGELIKILRPRRQRVCRELTWWWWTGLQVSKQVLSFLRDPAFGEIHADPLGRVLIQRVSYLFPMLQQRVGAPCQPPLVSWSFFLSASSPLSFLVLAMQSPFARLLF